jgi:hypothetical protein
MRAARIDAEDLNVALDGTLAAAPRRLARARLVY